MFSYIYHFLICDREEYPFIDGEVVVRYVRKEILCNKRLLIYGTIVLYGVLVIAIHQFIFHKFS